MNLLQHLLHFLHKNAISSTGRIQLSAQLELERRSALAICHEAEVGLNCSQGSLWVTQLGKHEDTILGPGQGMQVAAGQDLVIQAFSASTVQINLLNTLAGAEPDSMTVKFVDKWYSLPQRASRPRFSVEGQFGLAMDKS